MAIDKAKIETFGFTRDDIRNIAKEAVKEDAAKLVDEAIDEGRINIADNVEEVLEDASSGILTDLLGLDSEGKAKKQSLGAILQADKDILNQIVIEFNEDDMETSILFPKGVAPLYFISGNKKYYIGEYYDDAEEDYYNSILDKDGNSIFNDVSDIIDFEINSNNQLYIYIMDDGTVYNKIKNPTYICALISNGQNEIIDGYKLFNPPQPSAGTKLYKHTIELDVKGSFMNWIIINNSSSKLDTINKVWSAITALNTLKFKGSFEDNAEIYNISNIFYQNSTTLAFYCMGDSETSPSVVYINNTDLESVYDDEVTEL